MYLACSLVRFFFFNDTATTEIYTLSLHDALPIYRHRRHRDGQAGRPVRRRQPAARRRGRERRRVQQRRRDRVARSEEHTSELQSQSNLVCRLLLEKKKKYYSSSIPSPACANLQSR